MGEEQRERKESLYADSTQRVELDGAGRGTQSRDPEIMT